MEIMKSYPFVFKLEETMCKTSFGKRGKEYKIPSKLRSDYSHVTSVRLAYLSLQSGQEVVELFIDRRISRGVPRNEYYLRFCGRRIKWVPASIVFHSPEHLHAYLAQELRSDGTFKTFTCDYAVAYVDVFYPHLRPKYQVEIEEIVDNLAHHHFLMTGFKVEWKSNFAHGRLGFLIIAKLEDMSENDYDTFMEAVSDLKESLNEQAMEVTLACRKKMGLEDTGVSWKINRVHYHHISNSVREDPEYLKIFSGGEEMMSLTSKGLTLTIVATGKNNGDTHEYIVHLKENNKKAKKIGVINDSNDLDNHIKSLREMFHELFFDGLESFHLLITKAQSESELIEDWTSEKYNNILNQVSDTFDFELYGNKNCTNTRINDIHTLILLSNSDKLNDNRMLEYLYNLMSDMIQS